LIAAGVFIVLASIMLLIVNVVELMGQGPEEHATISDDSRVTADSRAAVGASVSVCGIIAGILIISYGADLQHQKSGYIWAA
jgi:hypothetical protein